MLAGQKHQDLPLETAWELRHLSDAERVETGLSAKAVAVLVLSFDAGWHTYSHVPGGFAKPTRLDATLGGAALQVLYPEGTPTKDTVNPGQTVNAYFSPAPIFVLLPQWPLNGDLKARLELLLCTDDRCLPARLELGLGPQDTAARPVRNASWWPQLVDAAKRHATSRDGGAGTNSVKADQADSSPASAAVAQTQPQVDGWNDLRPRYHQPELEVGGLLKAALLGLLAGFILNFMPCVLPVVSIKLSALLAGSGTGDEGARTRAFREHNLFFALGILCCFLLLGLVLGTTGLAWGQLFQRPGAVLGLACVVFLLSLSMFGVFSLPVLDLKAASSAAHPRAQAFSTGLLATLLATPCSGPFLGGVLGWTLLQPPWVIAGVLLSVGAGMALPYLLMALFPGVARSFPRPGPWTGRLENVVGLLLAGTCVYLLSILPGSRLIPALALLWFAACAAWLWGLAGPGFDSRRGVLLKLSAALFLGLGLWFGLRAPVPAAVMEPFSATSLRTRMGRETVLVDFTADWCPSCKALEQTTLTPERLGDMKKRHGLALMKADLTESNPEAEALLHALGSKSIPLLAIFPAHAPDAPLVLRDLFTPSQLEEALKSTARP